MAIKPRTKEEIQKDLTAAKAEAATAKAELEAFKKKVLDKAIDMQDQYGYCDGGLNDFLETVGLEVPGTDWTYCVSFQLNHANDDTLSTNEIEKAIEGALQKLVDANDGVRQIEETKYSGYPNYTTEKTGKKTFSVNVDDSYES